MGLYLHGLDLPSGRYRSLDIHPDGTVFAYYENQQLGRAIAVPSHGRLIDADRLKLVFEKNFYGLGGERLVQQLIDLAPTVIEKEE